MQLDFVVAARALGSPTLTLLRRHVLPNVMPAVLVATTLDVGRNILAESALSFLGLGVQPPTADLGLMVKSGFDSTLRGYPGEAIAAGTLIILIVWCVTVLGDRLTSNARSM